MHAVYPGSFDPPTNGHLDIIKRSSKIADYLIVAVLNNPSKVSLFSAKERVSMLKYLTKDIKNIKVMSFSGLLVDFCKKEGCNIIFRGLRAMTDFEYEFQLALTNKNMNNEIETLFLTSDTKNLWLSSSIVKEIAKFGGEYSSMVHPIVYQKMQDYIKKGKI